MNKKFKYPEISVAADVILFTKIKGRLNVLLIERKNEPFKGMYANPGGFLEENEDIPDGARRELLEETGVKAHELYEVGIFGKPGRDPRRRIITVAYMAIMEKPPEIKAADDASDARFFPVDKLPRLAFDHQEMISRALKILTNLETLREFVLR